MFKESYKLLDEMLSKGLKPDVVTYSALMDGLFRDQKVDDALRMSERVSSKIRPDVVMYNVVIRGLCSAGEAEPAFMLHSEMKSKNCKPKLATLNVLDGFCQLGAFERASDMWKEISRGFRARYRFIQHGYQWTLQLGKNT